jgi:hypothetical protein
MEWIEMGDGDLVGVSLGAGLIDLTAMAAKLSHIASVRFSVALGILTRSSASQFTLCLRYDSEEIGLSLLCTCLRVAFCRSHVGPASCAPNVNTSQSIKHVNSHPPRLAPVQMAPDAASPNGTCTLSTLKTAQKPSVTPNVLEVIFGSLLIKPWYPSFYPEELVGRKVERLYVCQWCFKYSKELMGYLGHLVRFDPHAQYQRF